jgi:hypothetical protein
MTKKEEACIKYLFFNKGVVVIVNTILSKELEVYGLFILVPLLPSC